MFGNRAKGNIWEGATGAWRKLNNEELHNSYASPYIVRRLRSMTKRWTGHARREDNLLLGDRGRYGA
jgi:hypothetical protein